MDDMEFKVDDIVTVDRYNHIDDVQKGTIKGYSKMQLSGTPTYLIDIDGVEIETTGISIMESKDYVPAPDNERHEPINKK
jgi:hypothetical protein